jgi:small subunit ribosomal protein S2
MAASNNYEKISKKEILNLSREQDKLEKTLGGIKDMGGLPDVLFVIDVGYEKIAVQEATKLGIPVVGIVDTNNSPDNIEYIVPGNDDSMRAIKLYTRLVADAIIDGKQSIVNADSDAELIEVDPDATPVVKSSVKITAKKSAAAAVAVDADDASAGAGTVAAPLTDDATDAASAEEAPAAEKAPKKAATKKAATKKAATKKAATKKAATKKAAATKSVSKAADADKE